MSMFLSRSCPSCYSLKLLLDQQAAEPKAADTTALRLVLQLACLRAATTPAVRGVSNTESAGNRGQQSSTE